MSTHHPSRRDADRILDAPAESDLPVGRALEALRAPGSTHELLREDATVAAFHAARLSPAPRTRSDMSRTTPRTAAVKAVAATGLVVALTSGGFALAATGHLPTLPDQASDRATEAVSQRTASAARPPPRPRRRPRPRAPRSRRPPPTATATETATEHHRRGHRVHLGGGHDRPDAELRGPVHGVPGQRQVGPRQGSRQRRVHRAGHRGRRQGRHRDVLRGPDR